MTYQPKWQENLTREPAHLKRRLAAFAPNGQTAANERVRSALTLVVARQQSHSPEPHCYRYKRRDTCQEALLQQLNESRTLRSQKK